MDQTCKYIVVEQIIENKYWKYFQVVKTKTRDKNTRWLKLGKYKMSDNM